MHGTRETARAHSGLHVKQQMRRALAGPLDKLPKNLRQDDEMKMLNAAASHKVYKIVHLIYRAKN